MSQIRFWKGCQSLSVKHSEENPLFDFVKLVTLYDDIFLLDKSHHIWQGTTQPDSTVALSRTNILAIDIGATSSHLYYVTESARVFRLSPGLESCEEIILYEEASNCIHGYATSSRRINVKQISAGGMGVIFVSDIGELWASGKHLPLGIETDYEPKKASFFEGRHVTLVSCGEDFNVIVSHKRDDICSVDHMENGEAEVFLSNCPHCMNESAISPSSPQSSSEKCALGNQYKKSCESLSASTSTSKNNEASDNKMSNDNSSSCTEDSPHISDITECHLTHSIEEEARNNEVRGDRVSSMLLINTEAARQFLTRQLSWVSSGGEELLAEVSGPTRLLRQNVTTVASLVYEGVKTVGDKVATLSRHVSGGSDNNSDSFEEFEELNHSNQSLNSSLRWDMSCSEASEEHGIEKGMFSRTKGARLIRSEVWVWGNTHMGQHGIGDFSKRNKPALASSVSHLGVSGVYCGHQHCLVQLLDGRVYGWGSNKNFQLSDSSEHLAQPTPTPVCGRAMSIAAGDDFSLILDRSGSLIALNEKLAEVIGNGTSDTDLEGLSASKVLGCRDIACVIFDKQLGKDSTLDSDIAHEQCFLEELLSVYNSLVKPLSRKSALDECVSNLCARYTDLLHATAVVVATLLQGRLSHDILSMYQDELLFIYDSYLTMVCDVIASNGFSHIPRNVETPALTAYFSDRLPSRKTSAEAVVTCAFFQPLSHLPVYKGMVIRGGGDGLSRWESLLDIMESKKKEAETTKAFWEIAGRLSETLRTPKRRIVKESKSSPISLQNSSRFSSHWFILLSDAFVHVTGGSHSIHDLHTVWVEFVNDSDNNQNLLVITTPEDSLTLTTANHLEKTEWFHAFQTTICKLLNKPVVSIARSASYTFTKHPIYKDAKYTGRWLSGKMHGNGKLEWPSGKVYSGQFHNNLCHGFGRLEVPGVSVFEGQWRDGLQNGHGITRYETGDVYNGYYKDGLENGHGVRKTGRFTSTQASVYIGEWLLGLRHGYGVLNSIGTGEKYMGCWSGNMKNGSGLIVTVDGIYYEGTFSQDILTGQGIMVFEDGTHYEGELKEPGVFGGKGVLTFPNGDYFVGSLHGTWTDGVKINGSLHKNFPPSSPEQSFAKPNVAGMKMYKVSDHLKVSLVGMHAPSRTVSHLELLPNSACFNIFQYSHSEVEIPYSESRTFGDFCVSADVKWKAIFRQCWSLLGSIGENKVLDTAKAWENVAVTLGSRHLSRVHDLLQTTPQFGRTSLNLQSFRQVRDYLTQAFENNHHPLGRTLGELVEAYTTTYSGVVHPLLLPQAVAELYSITHRLYQLVRLLFPALPPHSSQLVLADLPQDAVSMTTLLHPIILPRIYSSLLVLYSLHNKTEDETYWKRLLKWNRQPNSTLMAFLGIDKKFQKEEIFSGAVVTLQQLKTTFSPMEKLIVIQNTFQEITRSVQGELGEDFVWTMDDLFPVFHYVVVRSHIQGLGSELHYIDDFMEPSVKTGELGIMFTTLKACFFQILQEKVNVIS